MESGEPIRAALHPGMWTYSIDLKDTYFHIPMHPKSRKFLRVSFKGQAFQFKALSFELGSAPWLFTMVAKEFASLILSQNTVLHQFLDNCLGQAMYKEC